MIPLTACRRTTWAAGSWAATVLTGVLALATRPLMASDLPLDSLATSPTIDPATTGPEAPPTIESLLPPRTDTAADWWAPIEPLHRCGEPRLLPTCVPPAPCHPGLPPRPYDLVGVRGCPTCGPIYRGPCEPRTGSHDAGPLPRIHRVHDRLFDWFYNPRTPLLP